MAAFHLIIYGRFWVITEADLAGPNKEARRHRHEGEFKLILSSNLKNWNISENFIAEKNLGHAPWEFGYSAGATRRLGSNSTGKPCAFCWEKVSAGAEMYGGLGDTTELTLGHTSHYVSPIFGWQLARGAMLSFAPGFGLTQKTMDRVYRLGFAYEFTPGIVSFRHAKQASTLVRRPSTTRVFFPTN